MNHGAPMASPRLPQPRMSAQMLFAHPSAFCAPRRLRGRELLLDLDDLAVVDAVAVDDGDRLAVAHPAVAGVAGRHVRHRPAVEQRTTAIAGDLAHRVGDVARLRHRQPDGRVADHVDVLVLHRLVGDVVDLAPPLVGADEIRLHGDGARALRRDHVDHVVLHACRRTRSSTSRAPGSTFTTLFEPRYSRFG